MNGLPGFLAGPRIVETGQAKGRIALPPVRGPLTSLDPHPYMLGWGPFRRSHRAKNGPNMTYAP